MRLKSPGKTDLLGRPSRSRRTRDEMNRALEVIWHVISAIPRGRVSTYGSVARAAGLPGRARQTGFALRVAPDSLQLPWYRVVGAGGRIAFPADSQQFRNQSRLLRAEGVNVRNGRADASALIDLEDAAML